MEMNIPKKFKVASMNVTYTARCFAKRRRNRYGAVEVLAKVEADGGTIAEDPQGYGL